MKYTYLIVLLVLASSCAKKVEELPSTSSSILGNWSLRSVCQYLSSGSYISNSLSYSDNSTYTQTSRSFTNSTCTALSFTQTLGGNFYVTHRSSSFMSDVYDLDSTLDSWTITPATSLVASSFNSGALCGYTDWAMGIAKNVAGRNCSGTTMPSLGAVEYSFFEIQQLNMSASPPFIPAKFQGDLMFGTTSTTSNDGTTALKRHTVGDGTYIYRK